MKNNSAVALTLNDLNIGDVKVQALQKEESLGVPELGASLSVVACTTLTSIVPAAV
jgi:hypothetical protein